MLGCATRRVAVRAQGEGEYRAAFQVSILLEAQFSEGEDVDSVVVLRDGNGVVLSLVGNRVVAV